MKGHITARGSCGLETPPFPPLSHSSPTLSSALQFLVKKELLSYPCHSSPIICSALHFLVGSVRSSCCDLIGSTYINILYSYTVYTVTVSQQSLMTVITVSMQLKAARIAHATHTTNRQMQQLSYDRAYSRP